MRRKIVGQKWTRKALEDGRKGALMWLHLGSVFGRAKADE